MKKIPFSLMIVVVILTACSSGKKAMEKGDYFTAVEKSVQRLRSNPDNSKAADILKSSYDLAINWSQEEMDRILTLNEPYKWGSAVGLMEQVNNLCDEIRQSPAARKMIPSPKVYTSELNSARRNAAEERYAAGIAEMEMKTRESARQAFDHFNKTNNFVPGYKDVLKKLDEAKSIATLTVILEAIPVHAIKYQLSSEFFYDQVFEYLNRKFPTQEFVNFYSPKQAQSIGLKNPDMVVRIEFFDFAVGNSNHIEKEEEVKQRVKIDSKDTTKIVYKDYVAKLKTFTDKVVSGGVLDLKIVEFNGEKLLVSDRIPGSFTWINEYAMFVGDREALSKEQNELTNNKPQSLPSGQDLFIEFTKPIYDQLTSRLNQFFRKYN
jgi:hypothetical protein